MLKIHFYFIRVRLPEWEESGIKIRGDRRDRGDIEVAGLNGLCGLTYITIFHCFPRILEDKSYFKALPPQEEEESESQERYCSCSLTNQVQTKVECNTTETHLAKIDENEKRLMAKSFSNAFGSFSRSNDCANKVSTAKTESTMSYSFFRKTQRGLFISVA